MEDNRYESEETVVEERKLTGVTIAKAAALLVIAVLLVVMSGRMADPATYDGTINSLDDTKATVAKMAAGTTAASAAITMIPGDAGTPIAEQLADFSGYFVFIYSAIYVEKYLTTTGGLIAFRFLLPIALLLLAFFVLRSEGEYAEKARRLGRNLLVFSLVLWLVVPCSVMISKNIEKTYQNSVNETLDQAQLNVEELKEKAEKAESEESLIDSITEKVKGATTGTLEKFENTLNNMLDAIAVMIVTTCVIPICVLLFLFWVMRMLFGVNVGLPDPRGLGRKAVHRFKR